MLLRNARLNLLAIIALVLLRFLVGYHFFMEGATKVRERNFSSAGFLSAAKGPFAKSFQSMVPDFYGLARLDKEQMKAAYEQFAEQASAYYSFTEEQRNEAKGVVDGAMQQLTAVYQEWKPQIYEYKQGVGRVARLEDDPIRSRVASGLKQKDDIETKWKALAKPVLSEIDKINAEVEQRINQIATTAQADKKTPVMFKLPGAGPIDVRTIDKVIPIFDMCVGILLMFGLLTPLAGLAAGLFLASVVLTQFPGSYGAQPTYYQAIEMLACFFLAFSDAGRYAGLDFLPWSFWNRNKRTNED